MVFDRVKSLNRSQISAELTSPMDENISGSTGLNQADKAAIGGNHE